tara:strand:- start:464 stop:1081 length:618 start_codon:yes stop_codon:yes gene_type:complete
MKFKRHLTLFSERPKYKSIGLARVSNVSQSFEAQVSALKGEGCCVVFQEVISTRYKNVERPQLIEAIEALDKDDELVVAKLDRLGRTQLEVVSLLHQLQKEGKHVRTLDGLINTRRLGKIADVLIDFFVGLSELERSLVKERTLENIQHRRETGGNLGGRPKTNTEKEGLVIRLRNEGCSYRSIRKQTGLALSTIRRIIVEKDLV